MVETTIKALERSEKPNKVRLAGFTPGVLNGPGTASTTVKFDTLALNKIISKHGMNAKMWVEIGGEKIFGFIKEIQKHPVEGKIIHVAVQLVSKDQEVKMQLPITFHGHAELERRLLKVQVYKSEVEVFGKTAFMPDSIVVDVSEKEIGNEITAADFSLPEGIKILDADNEIYAIIKTNVEASHDEPEEEKPAE
jgi:large subunit ribosomal protein L25